jgi:integrase
MSGSRPLNDQEIEMVLSHLTNLRDKTLFIIGLRTGFRISELLSLTIEGVTQYGQVSAHITVNRKNMKGKRSSRTVPLHPQAKAIVQQYLGTITNASGDTKLFPIKRRQASNVIKMAFTKAKLEGRVSTHSMRKSFCNKVHLALGENIFKTQKAMGHASLSSTAHYLSFNEDEINNAIVGV